MKFKWQDDEWRAWPVLVGAGIGFGTTVQLFAYTQSLTMPHLVKEFGWTRGEISQVIGLAGLGAAASPIIGWLLDRFGVRPVVLVCSLLLGATYIGMAAMPGSLALFFGLVLVKSMVSGGVSGMPQSRVIAGWFRRNRGLALSLMMTMLPIIAALFVPQFQKLLSAYGWRAGFVLLAGMTVLVGLPVMMLTMRERKADEPGDGRGVPAAPEEGLDAKAGLRSPALWLIIAAMTCVNIPGGGIWLHMFPMMTDKGFSPTDAASLIAIFPLAMICGRLASGALLDRYSPSVISATATLLPALGYCVFLFGGDDMPFAAGAVAVALLGVQQGAELDLVSFLMARHMGLRAFGFLFGVAWMANAFTVSAGTLLFGWTFDLAGSYAPVFLLATFAFPTAAVCFFALRWFPVFQHGAAAKSPPPRKAVASAAAE
jgi:predicted MFS family arabinose efflux permease